MPAKAKATRLDGQFWAEYITHVGRSTACGCNVDGSDPGCSLGEALWRCAHRKREEVSQVNLRT